MSGLATRRDLGNRDGNADPRAGDSACLITAVSLTGSGRKAIFRFDQRRGIILPYRNSRNSNPRGGGRCRRGGAGRLDRFHRRAAAACDRRTIFVRRSAARALVAKRKRRHTLPAANRRQLSKRLGDRAGWPRRLVPGRELRFRRRHRVLLSCSYRCVGCGRQRLVSSA